MQSDQFGRVGKEGTIAGRRMTVNTTPPPQFALTIAESLESLGVPDGNGLSTDEVVRRRAIYGFNELKEPSAVPLWKKFLAQFKSLLVWILIIAAVLSGALGDWTDTLAILAIVVLNAVLGFLQEEKAERALAGLQKLSAPLTRVRRDTVLLSIPARELLPGDRIELEAGDIIPADSRLMIAFGFRSQEAALTGESTPVDKDAQCNVSPGTPLGDRKNMVYMGTVAAAGKASAIVVATGMCTELGQIAQMLEIRDIEPTPLQRRLDKLGKSLAVVCLVLVALVFLLELLHGGELHSVFLRAVSLAVAAVPEGLPAVVTMALALGLQRMVRRNALVRKLPSVETLGAVTVICSDKTGTLTRNEMTVRELVAGDRRYQLTGAGYSPHGRINLSSDHHSKGNGAIVDPNTEVDLVRALVVGARCNNASVLPGADAQAPWKVIGDPTEGALLIAAMKAGIAPEFNRNTVLYEIPFDSERKVMSVVVREADGQSRHYCKGAPEVILDKCTAEQRAGVVVSLNDVRRRELAELNSEMASRALRVLGLAFRDVAVDETPVVEERDLVFAGLVGMLDPPREEAKLAVGTCREAGIRPVMITGDHPETALAIARELGIASSGDRVLTSVDLDAMDDAELTQSVDRISVYARVSAEHKFRIVKAWKRRDEIVAMTGDGMNDAPAIRAADIGIAMGMTGTDVTKEVSSMVLVDDNFASIVSAVEEGRAIYDNIQNVVIYLLSCNAGEIFLMLVASLLGWPAPLLPIQLLWINLVTDGLPALALSLEAPEPGIMRRRPRPASEPILSLRTGLTILWQGLVVGGAALAAFAVIYWSHPEQEARARTMAFCVLVFGELLRALAARSQRLTLWQLGFFTNPALLAAVSLSALLQLSLVTLPYARSVFETVADFGWEWSLLLGLALVPITAIELEKLWRRAGTLATESPSTCQAPAVETLSKHGKT